MKKLALTLYLILALATSVSAEWKKVYTHPEVVMYIDADNMRRRGAIVYAERLYDLFGPKWAGGFKSTQQKVEIDCVAGGIRVLNWFYFDGFGGSGYRSTQRNYQCKKTCYPASNSLDYVSVQAICQLAGL